MISFHTLKQHNKIFLVFFVTLCLSGLIAPVVKSTCDALASVSPVMAHLLNYKHGSYDFGRVMRRILMAMAVLLVVLLRKPLMAGTFVTDGMKQTHEWRERLQMGFLLSTGIFVLFTAYLCAWGAKTLQIDAKSLGDVILQLLKILLIAGVVGCIEEILFRGFILQSFLHGMQTVCAVCASSLFYSLLHFFKAKYPVTSGFHPLAGFTVIYYSFANILGDLAQILPSLIGLFLVGVVLSYAFLWTRSLYFSIGLHAGWVFIVKANNLFFNHTETSLRWLFGDSKAVTGVLGWGLLIVTLILVRHVTKVLPGKALSRPEY